MTYAFVVAVLAVAALAYVAGPLRRSERPTDQPDPLSELEENKTVALTAILDLENERDVGKLSDEDFAELRAVYEKQALDALHQMDQVPAADLADPLEREIAHVRDRLSASRCSACGAHLPTGVSVCARCGA